MKKFMILIISIFAFPLQIFAYSKYIIPGGETLGIELKTKGVLVIGFYDINGKTNKSNLKIGDYITAINGKNIYTIKDLQNEIENNLDNSITIKYLRNNKEYTTNLNLIYDNKIYKTGLYVKDNIIGIGTLTYIDPNTSIYGALGHEIIESKSKELVEIKTGTIFENSITSISKSKIGIPGSKNANFYYNNTYGDIKKNTVHGIYGNYSNEYPNKELLEISEPKDVKVGPAKIYTVLDKEEIKEYEINITKINETANTKNIEFEIIDEELVDKAGGIVQGMSGSPIIQNDKIIGAITHVIIDNPITGYGIFITTMLEEGEKK